MIPHVEAEGRRREVRPEKPSSWGEMEVREWCKKIREEKDKIAQEKRERERWSNPSERVSGRTFSHGTSVNPNKKAQDRNPSGVTPCLCWMSGREIRD